MTPSKPPRMTPLHNPWIKHWIVTGTSGKEYKVSQRQDGSFGCSCPAWIFSKVKPKPDCQHILQIRLKAATPEKISISKITNMNDDKVTRSITFED